MALAWEKVDPKLPGIGKLGFGLAVELEELLEVGKLLLLLLMLVVLLSKSLDERRVRKGVGDLAAALPSCCSPGM
jgi:hypothetical protein